MPGYDCGGHELKEWADGTPSYWGHSWLTDLFVCEKNCNEHDECIGFVHDTTVNICAYWKGGPPPIHPLIIHPLIGRTCHKKTSGNSLFDNITRF